MLRVAIRCINALLFAYLSDDTVLGRVALLPLTEKLVGQKANKYEDDNPTHNPEDYFHSVIWRIERAEVSNLVGHCLVLPRVVYWPPIRLRLAA